MALFDFITGIKDKLPQYGNIAAELGTPQTYSNGGELAVQQLRPTLFNRITGLGDKIYDGLFGKIVDNSGVNDGTLSATVNNPHREGGVLADLQSGFRENAQNGFQPQNLMGNGGSLARKIGEGFGTALRFADSPLGRGVLVGGAIGALGGTPAEMAAYGLGTTALNQGNRTADRLYRDDLIKTAQQSLRYSPEFNSLSADEITTIKQGVEMGADYQNATPEQKQLMLQNAAAEYLRGRQAEQLQNIVNQVGSMRGYVRPDVYRNLLASQQLRDNADYKNMYLNAQIANQQAMQDLRKDQLAFQMSDAEARRADKAADRAVTMRGQDLGYAAKIQEAIEKQEEKLAKANEKQELINSTLDKLGVLMDMHGKLAQNFAPSGTKYITSKTLGGLNALGIKSDEMAAYDGAANLVTNLIMRKIAEEKGVATDRDFERAKAMTPQLSDTPGQAEAKTKAIYSLLGVPYNKNINGSSNKSNTTTTTKSGTKYKVID